MSNYKNDIEAINLSDNLENNIIEKDIWNITSAQPELKAAKSRINSAKLSTSILKTNYYPSITIQLGMNSFYNNLLNTKDKSSFLKQYSKTILFKKLGYLQIFLFLIKALPNYKLNKVK